MEISAPFATFPLSLSCFVLTFVGIKRDYYLGVPDSLVHK